MRRLLHIAVHGGINANAGDILLTEATRWLFDQCLGPSEWSLGQAWAPFDARIANTFDGVVVGGGGMLLPDQEGASYEASGWQWNCPLEQLARLQVPLIVFGVGHNQFRGKHAFAPHFAQHWAATRKKAAFLGLREKAEGYTYQPCPTTLLQKLGIQPKPAYRTLGLNVATDRAVLRYGAHGEDRVFRAITQTCKVVVARGWRLQVLCHKPQDQAILPWLADAHVPHTMVPLWDAKPMDVVAAYEQMNLMLAMRGHAQLIPFGLGIRSVSIISHDKLGRFLDDIGHPEWGVDVQHPHFAFALWTATQHLLESTTVAADIATAQEALWATTQQNMTQISARLA